MKRERIVSIRALAGKILEKWRLILLAGILLAVLAGGYKAIGLRALLQQAAAGGDAAEEQAEPAVATDSADLYDEMAILESAYDNRNMYIRESLLFRIDPAKEGRASFLLRVKVPGAQETAAAGAAAAGANTEAATAAGAEAAGAEASAAAETAAGEAAQEDMLGLSIYAPKRGSQQNGQIVYVGTQNRDEAQLLKSYLNFILEGIDWSGLAQEFGTKPQFLQELVDAEEYAGLSGARITVIYENVEGAQKILDYIEEQVNAYAAVLAPDLGEHSLLISEKRSGVFSDPDMEDWVDNEYYSVTNLYTYKTSIGRTLPAASGGGGESAAVPMKTLVKIIVKFVIFGFVLGVILAAGLYAVLLMISGVVLSARELNTQYDLDRLAVFAAKHKNSPLDRLAARIDSGYTTGADRKAGFAIAVENTLARMHGRGRVAVISDLPDNVVESVVTRLNQAAKGSSLTYIGADIAHSADGISDLCAADAAVLLAQSGRSRYGELYDLLKTAGSAGKTVLGSIVF